MITSTDLKKYDSSGMCEIYDKWPEIAKKAYQIEYSSFDFGNIDNIIFTGMGGSGAIGDIFSAILSKTDIHVNVVKGYTLPKTVDSETLVVCTSVSGNTVETLNVLELANKMNCKLICFSSGGKMQQFCQKNNILYKNIPMLHSPRASFVIYLYSILKLFEKLIPVSKDDVLESISALENLSLMISSQNLINNPSIELAEWINDTPKIYYPAGFQSVAIRFKNSLQENAKIQTMIEDVIEACHNDIVSWEGRGNFSPILIRGPDDYFKTKERWNIIKDYFSQNNIEFKEINSTNGNILSKIVYLVYLLDYTSIYHAVKNKIDPTPVSSIDFVKKHLS